MVFVFFLGVFWVCKRVLATQVCFRREQQTVFLTSKQEMSSLLACIIRIHERRNQLFVKKNGHANILDTLVV